MRIGPRINEIEKRLGMGAIPESERLQTIVGVVSNGVFCPWIQRIQSRKEKRNS